MVSLRSILVFLAVTGWTACAGLVWIARETIFAKVERHFSSPDAVFQARLEHRMAEAAAAQWFDSRPTLLFLGDSHMEMGPWYTQFKGRYAVCNYGLSRAQIGHVTQIAARVPSDRFAGLVLMCGINNIGVETRVDDCLRDYQGLLAEVKRLVPAGRVLVFPILPVRAAAGDARAEKINQIVAAVNVGLRELCRASGAHYLDSVDRLLDNGALRPGVTWDGLHLNEQGYALLAEKLDAAIQSHIPQNHE